MVCACACDELSRAAQQDFTPVGCSKSPDFSPATPARAERCPSNSLYLSLGEWPRLPFTARIERAQFHRARSASKKGTWPLPPLLTDFFSILPSIIVLIPMRNIA